MYSIFFFLASSLLVSSIPINPDAFVEVATTSKPIKCPEGSFEGYSSKQCYQIFNNSLYFMDAELTCNKLGGHLASIHNAFDNMLINGNARALLGANATFFNGATNLVSGFSTYAWIDQTSFDYTDFSYPMSNNQDMNCLQIHTDNGQWHTADCYTPAPYVCEVASI